MEIKPLTKASLVENGQKRSIFAKQVVDFSSQYGNEMSISYTMSNLAGCSNIYPKYGDFTQSAVFRTYGKWWKLSRYHQKKSNRIHPKFKSQDFVEFSLNEKLFVEGIHIFETYNPGMVYRILVCDTSFQLRQQGVSNIKWLVLWHSESQVQLYTSQILTIKPMRECTFPTDSIRIEFNHEFMDYFSELDAVRVEGRIYKLPIKRALLKSTQISCSNIIDNNLAQGLMPNDDDKNSYYEQSINNISCFKNKYSTFSSNQDNNSLLDIENSVKIKKNDNLQNENAQIKAHPNDLAECKTSMTNNISYSDNAQSISSYVKNNNNNRSEINYGDRIVLKSNDSTLNLNIWSVKLVNVSIPILESSVDPISFNTDSNTSSSQSFSDKITDSDSNSPELNPESDKIKCAPLNKKRHVESAKDLHSLEVSNVSLKLRNISSKCSMENKEDNNDKYSELLNLKNDLEKSEKIEIDSNISEDFITNQNYNYINSPIISINFSNINRKNNLTSDINFNNTNLENDIVAIENNIKFNSGINIGDDVAIENDIKFNSGINIRDVIAIENEELCNTNKNYKQISELEFNLEECLFYSLPEEIVQIILGHLDLLSLCRLSQTCRFFWKHCLDTPQYYNVDIQPYWHKVDDQMLINLTPRCSKSHTVNLSWCSNLKSTSFVGFLKICGGTLVILSLNCCRFIGEQALVAIGEYCPKLQELRLQSCTKSSGQYFYYLSKLTQLKVIDLYRTLIDDLSIISIVRSCTQLECLNLGSCCNITDMEKIAIELGENCPKLRCVDFWRGKNVTHIGLNALVRGCPYLEEFDLGWCNLLKSNSGCFIETSKGCPNLKKLFLTANRTVSNQDLECFAEHSRNLEQLDILGTTEVSPRSVQKLLEGCKNLKLLDVSFCFGIESDTVESWVNLYPNVNIKRSYQHNE